MRRYLAITTFALSLLIIGGLGCSKVQEMIGSRTVDSADASSPEGVILDMMRSGLEPDPKKGWQMFKKLLHSEQNNRISLISWEQNNYSTFRRKVFHYLADDKVPTYEIDKTEEPMDDEVKIFVVNERSDMPTPCRLKRDPQADNAWRIMQCSL